MTVCSSVVANGQMMGSDGTREMPQLTVTMSNARMVHTHAVVAHTPAAGATAGEASTDIIMMLTVSGLGESSGSGVEMRPRFTVGACTLL